MVPGGGVEERKEKKNMLPDLARPMNRIFSFSFPKILHKRHTKISQLVSYPVSFLSHSLFSLLSRSL